MQGPESAAGVQEISSLPGVSLAWPCRGTTLTISEQGSGDLCSTPRPAPWRGVRPDAGQPGPTPAARAGLAGCEQEGVLRAQLPSTIIHGHPQRAKV